MIEIFRFDTERLERASRQVANLTQIYPKAARKVQGKVLKAVRRRLAEKTSELNYVTVRQIEGSMEIFGGAIRLRDRRHNLKTYMARLIKSPGRRAQGLMGAVKRAGGLKHIPHGFLVNLGGNVLAFERHGYSKSGSWRNVEKLYAPAYAQIVLDKEVVDAGIKRGEEVFNENMRLEIMKELRAIK